MKLELIHLAPYLPYKLRAKQFGKIFTMVCQPYKDNHIALHSILVNTGTKPILRPLSDITKEIEHNGKKLIFLEKVEKADPFGTFFLDYDKLETGGLNQRPAWVVQSMIEYHFDVFGLIKKGLAIDINTLKK